ncbi:MAG: tRNA epoxyqueuosine(34) reductase QueG, partial [Thermoanaerobaculia bacterium]|nr:tRNA epoxyqueuosine(34) reductase QueG [Thermoanaerobaculia bacterium]
MNAKRDAEVLIAMALEVGFDAAGIASIERLEHGQAYLDWLAADHHAGMEYLKRRVEARLEPSHILEGVASVLCVAMRYAPLDGDPAPNNDLWSRVAKYAHGIDYHDVMGRLLRELAERIGALYPGIEARWYVDTGPVLERELAARAGLGVVGKNTCLLHRDMGSWFLLGELFLTLPLEPSEPLTDLCGRCTLCLDACPTDALLEPYRLDANRCISFWTIEHRGTLPGEARDMVGDWVFG